MELDKLDLEGRIEGIRATLEKIGKDFTDDVENSEIREDDWQFRERRESCELPEYDEELNRNFDEQSGDIIVIKEEINQLRRVLSQKDRQIGQILLDHEEIIQDNQKMQETIRFYQKKNERLQVKVNLLKKQLQKFQVDREHLEENLSSSQRNLEKLRKTLKEKEECQEKGNLLKPEGKEKSFKQSFDFETGKIDVLGQEGSYRLICVEAMKIVGVSKTKDFYSKLHHLQNRHLKYKKSVKLIDRLSDMVVQCSPSGSFDKEPSIHQIWRWVTSLVEEYMKIKKITGLAVIEKLMDLTGTSDVDSLFEKIKNNLKA